MRIPDDLPTELKLYYYYTTEDGNVIMCVPEALLPIADKGAAYTQQPIEIYDAETDDLITCRQWYGVPYNKKDDPHTRKPISFGDFGYYGDWD